ncbi:hypothetical protein DH2020_013498 [Rehmannia glutinosa]|uniref:CRAL-TRIO domain-containing protein n=1 Tax=Rehmannia glutinosa TaxID=99300 RepID=A0ABR0X5T1_REHGL
MEGKLKEEKVEEIFYSPEKMEDKDEGNGVTYNDQEEEKKLGDLRDIVEKQDPACKMRTSCTGHRRSHTETVFLRARDLDVDKASAMLMKYLKWRQKFVPNGYISASEITNQIAHNKMFMQGTDKEGCPVSVIIGAKHFPSKGGTDELKRFAVFALDKLCSRVPDGQEKFTIITDLQGYGYSNTDVRGYVAALSILQIIFVEDKRMHATLLEEIDESQLPEIYGGKMQLVPIQDG